MFRKKMLVVSYVYSFDYSKEPLELNELMFEKVPAKKKWGKYVLLNPEDQERFGLSVTKKDFEKVLKKGVTILCFLNVILLKMYLKLVGYLIKSLMFVVVDVLNE